jgi:hypothetical protein
LRIAVASLFVLWALLLAASCQPAAVEADMPKEVTPSERDGAIAPTEGDTPMPPPASASTPSDPALQTLIKLASADLAQRLSISVTQINFIEAMPVEWPDASLGCPQPGVMYLQVITPGYRIRLEAAGQEHSYHADRGTRVIYCNDATLQVSSAPTQEVATPDRFDQPVTELPERVPPTETVSSMTGEVPGELLKKIIADLAERTGVAPDRILVIQGQAIIWNDGSLGCAMPGEFYTQAQVNGYWVILEIDGKQYDYRATDRGYFFLCEGRFRPTPPTGTPSS